MTISSKPPIDLVYITGVSFCGSTLLALLFDDHPEVLSIGEMGPTRRSEKAGYLCSCGIELARCPFYAKVRERMETAGVAFDAGRMDLRQEHSLHPLWRRVWAGRSGLPPLDRLRDAVRDRLPHFQRRLEDYRRRNASFMRAALEVSGKRVFLDGTKHPRRIPFLQSLDGVHLRVIHLVRDPRGYCYSARRHQQKPPEVGAAEWVEGNASADKMQVRLPAECWRRVRYEDLCRDPEAQLAALAEFAGIAPFQVPGNLREQPHHIIGNQMRGSGTRSIRLDEKWRKHVTARDNDTVERIAGTLASRYGYDLTR